MRPRGWPHDRREALGFGLVIGQLVTVFGIALSYGLLALGIVTAGWCARWRLRQRLRIDHGGWLLWPLGWYLALLVVAVVLSQRPARSVGQLGDVFAVAAPIVLALLFVRGEPRVRLVVDCLIGAGAAFAMVGVGQLLVGAGSLSLERRIAGPFSHYQTFAGVLLLCDLLAIATVAYGAREGRWLRAAAAGLMSVALVINLTRGAWVALAAAVLLLLLLRAPKALLASVPVLLIAFLLAPSRVIDRAASIVDPRDPSNYDRLCMAYSGLLMVREYPVFGVGPEMVKELYPIYRHPSAPKLERPHLHDTYLELAAERGIPALLVWLWMFGGSAWLAFEQYRREGGREGPRADLLVGSVLGLLAFAVAGLFEYNWGDTEVQRIVLFLLCVPYCLRSRTEIP